MQLVYLPTNLRVPFNSTITCRYPPENQPFEDLFAIQNGDFHCHLSFQGCKYTRTFFHGSYNGKHQCILPPAPSLTGSSFMKRLWPAKAHQMVGCRNFVHIPRRSTNG